MISLLNMSVGNYRGMKIKSVFIFCCRCISLCACMFIECHDDPNFVPEPGVLKVLQFTWLGALQYIHVKNGNPHYFKVPRVVLITRYFVLSTANDVAQVPKGYALGNIIFGEYERDEDECNINLEDREKGAECEPTILIIPIADVLLHPEYKNFDERNSIALIKLLSPMKSRYMSPVCLPLRKYVLRNDDKVPMQKLYYIDFASDVPRDFMSEEKTVDLIGFLPRELCNLYHDVSMNDTRFLTRRLVCSTGCGFRSGAPSIIHERTGHWTVVAIAQGYYPCPDPLIGRRILDPPRHLFIYPYVEWISRAITGTTSMGLAKDDPFGFARPRALAAKKYDPKKSGWIGRWWMGGIRCYDRGTASDELFRFYHEVFQINPKMETNMRYYLELETTPNIAIVCVKVGMPYNLGTPRVWDLETDNIKLRIPVIKLRHKYKIEVEAWGTNRSLIHNDEIIDYDPS